MMRSLAVLATALVVGVFGRDPELWQLHKLDLDKFPLARCLDGSPGSFYIRKGSGSGQNSFLIHTQGGGWCLDPESCYSRSQGDLGSSANLQSEVDCAMKGTKGNPCVHDGDSGLQSSLKSDNKEMWDWNHAYINYCDGGSYAGDVTDPVSVTVDGKDKVVYMRGRHVLEGIYDTLIQGFGLNAAESVVISGTSAGGLAVYLHADFLREKVQSVSPKANVVAVPDAGFFLDYPSFSGEYLYTPKYQYVFAMQNASGFVNQDCIGQYSKDESWRCFMAQYTLPFIKTPVFVANSLMDSWSARNIMGLTCDPSGKNSSAICTEDEQAYVAKWREAFVSTLSPFLGKPGAGAWLVNCYQHPIVDEIHYWSEVTIQQTDLHSTFASWHAQSAQQPWVRVDEMGVANPKC
jgi:hypothetical protein